MENSSEELERLNFGSAADRLSELERRAASLVRIPENGLSNDHIHTFYSFSEYSPAAAAYFAAGCGFSRIGIADHDSVSGAEEFISAGRILGIGTIIGCECRVKTDLTALSGMRLNSPDQTSLAYVVMHDIPERNIGMVDRYFAPRRKLRLERDEKMCERLSELTRPLGIEVDFESDVLPLSHSDEGGSVTERHIVLALARKLLSVAKNDAELGVLLYRLGVKLCRSVIGEADAETRLLNLLKSDFVESFYIPAAEECQYVREFIDFCAEVGAVPAYAYLGDVINASGSDKKPQKYEDDELDFIIPELKRLGFGAVTYMPCRNTKAQIKRIKELCESYDLIAVTGCESPCGNTL